jgi:phosphoglycerate dehydrogenase-like enzyme
VILRVVVAGLPGADALDPLRTRFPDIAFSWSSDDPPAGIAEADVLVAADVPGAWIEMAPRLRWVHAPSAGVERVLRPGLAARGIAVSSSRGTYDQPVAEHALALLLALARRLADLAALRGRHEWLDLSIVPGIVELAGRTLAVVGMGSIGGRVAEMAAAIGMRVLGVRRRPAPHPAAERVVGLDGLLAVLSESDALVAALPEAPGTRRLLGRRELSALRPGALVVNVGRGSAMDQEALVDLLRSGRLGGAGLDVADPEPPPSDSPLWTAPNLILTGHTAGSSEHYPRRQLACFAENLQAFLDGRELPGRVDAAAGY